MVKFQVHYEGSPRVIRIKILMLIKITILLHKLIISNLLNNIIRFYAPSREEMQRIRKFFFHITLYDKFL